MDISKPMRTVTSIEFSALDEEAKMKIVDEFYSDKLIYISHRTEPLNADRLCAVCKEVEYVKSMMFHAVPQFKDIDICDSDICYNIGLLHVLA